MEVFLPPLYSNIAIDIDMVWVWAGVLLKKSQLRKDGPGPEPKLCVLF